MKLTVIGCAGTYPGPESPCSSYLLEHDGFRLLVDAGNGSTGILQRSIDILDLDAIVISHLHGDHFLDLITYTYARRYHPSGMPQRLPVYGPSDIEARVSGVYGYPTGDLLAQVYAFNPVSRAGRMDIGPFTVDLAPVVHPVETYGMRIAAGGRTLAYSADSGACDELVKVAREADVFLCEASYLEGEDNPPNIHLTGKEAGEHAARADVGRLLLTHLVPWGDPDRTLTEATSAYSGDIAVASSCAVFDI